MHAPQTPLAGPEAPVEITMPVLGMTCSACQTHVEKSLREAPGVVSASVSLMAHSAQIVFNPAVTAPQQLVDVVHESGYDATLPEPDSAPQHSHEESPAEERSLQIRAIATILGGAAAMLLSMPLMHSGASHTALDSFLMRAMPFLYSVSPQAIRLTLLALSLGAIFWSGRPIYQRAWKAALHRSTNMNTLVALGTGAAFVYSVAATFFPAQFLSHGLQPDVYYESVLLILGFLLLGNWLDSRAKRRTLDALEAFARLQPQTVRLRRGADQAEVEVPLASVVSGDRVVVRPGERIPVDGIIVNGSSSVDESLITGESTPVSRVPGDRLIGGSLNYDGAIEYTATSIGKDSVLGQMLRLMQQAQSSKAPMQQLADRVSSIFVPVVLALTAITFFAWLLLDHSGGITRAFAVSIAVLVIACPCAMGLAVPAALTVAVGRGAQLGILFKGGEAIERLARVDTIVLDKTGTLTTGHPSITAIRAIAPHGETAILQLAAALEHSSEHPLARAVLAAAQQRNVSLLPVNESRAVPGQGITGLIEIPGQSPSRVAAGNAALMASLGVALDKAPAITAGATPLYIASNNRLIGVLEAADALRPGAAASIANLQRSGLATILLTGDTEAAAQPIAAQTGISQIFAGLLPAEKLDQIRTLQQQCHKVAMVGDGINDAAALAQADAGLAIGTGTDLAREAGDAILLRGEPGQIVTAIQLARHTLRVMRQNLGWALGYNLLGIPIAAGVLYPALHLLLSPAVAAAAMALSSVSVLANSLRLRRFLPQ